MTPVTPILSPTLLSRHAKCSPRMALAASCLICLAVAPRPASAGITVTDSTDANALAAALFSGIGGVSLVPGSATLIGQASGGVDATDFGGNSAGPAGAQQGFSPPLPMSSALAAALSSAPAPPPMSSARIVMPPISRIYRLETPGDSDLDALATAIAGQPANTFDANILSFQFTVAPTVTNLGFKYVFGSQEYNHTSARSSTTYSAFTWTARTSLWCRGPTTRLGQYH